MRYVDEFRDKDLVKRFAQEIKGITPRRKINIMEVCGTHTQSFRRFGLKKLLPENIRLIAGPGCPVCVSHQDYIDLAIRLAQEKDVITITFADMLRVPGTNSTLEKIRAESADVRMVYSALDSLAVAKLNPHKRVVFLAVGFETTAPTIALSILAAKDAKIKNLFFLSSLKLIPPAMGYLLEDEALSLDGFLCPGHVSAIIGTKPYEFIPKEYGLACCVAGFEPVDILEGVYLLLKQITTNHPRVDNQYSRVVKNSGNPTAREIMYSVFKEAAVFWRGLGELPKSGLVIRNEFSRFDAEKEFCLKQNGRRALERKTKCRCGDILKGIIIPSECSLFAKACTPDNPVGPCMVSGEGACNAHYRYQ
ncbi:MAG: hydrogenase formation protein HypD [Candidatus Omnitrophota bacterium]